MTNDPTPTKVFEIDRFDVDTRERSRRWRGRAAFAVLAAALVAAPFAGALFRAGGVAGVLVVAGFLGFFGLREAGANAAKPTSRGKAKLSCSKRELVVEHGGDTIIVPRASVTDAYIDERDSVVLELADGRRLGLATPNLTQGASVLDALGLPVRRVRKLSVLSAADRGSGAGRIFGALGLFLAALGVVGGAVGTVTTLASRAPGVTFGALGVLALCLPVVIALRGYFRQRHIIVGADGVIIRSAAKPRFISFANVKSVESDGFVITLRLDDEEVVAIPVRFRGQQQNDVQSELLGTDGDLATMLQQIRRGVEAAGSSGEAAAKLGRLKRGSRSVGAWRAALLASSSTDGDYRAASLEPEDLTLVAEDATASPEQRVAATVALRNVGSEEQHQRVRIAIGGCADDDMRQALEAAAEGEIAEEALDRASLKRVLE